MRLSVFALLGLLLLSPPIRAEDPPAASSGEEPAVPELPFHLPLPEGWRAETIPFPLGFAPGLEYEGLEELRFSPGMFKDEAEDYWSYSFVWWVSADTDWSVERLEDDLEEYFRGLTDAVAQGEFDPGDPEYEASLESVDVESSRSRHLRGTVDAFDPFTRRAAVTLNVELEIWTCEEVGRDVGYFALSPQPPDHSVWKVLRVIRSGFRCER